MLNFNSKLAGKIFIILFALIILGASFFAGVFYGYENRPGIEKVLNVAGKDAPSQYEAVDFNLFWDVWSKLENKYVDKEKIKRQDMVYGAISGLVKSLEDPYSEFLSPEIAKQFREDISGSFEGIGAEIGIRRSILTIISPLKDSPAERAGLKAGDKVLKVDDMPTADYTLDQLVRMIRGPKGTEVILTIFRDGLDKTKEIKIIRDTIRVDAISTEQKTSVLAESENSGSENQKSAPKDIFVIKLSHFSQNAAFEFRSAVKEFYETDSKKLILDLRNNPGGFLQISVDIASWFLPPGEIVARERFADGSEEIYRSNGYRLLANIPTVILINEGSASASEIVAGALRDHKGLKLIGRKTFGKGSVQEVEDLVGGASLKITIAKWLTPNGTEIDNVGLEPDYEVKWPEDEKELETLGERDLDMEKAIEILSGF